jgi:hypothetical protein
VPYPSFGQQLDHSCRNVCHACSLGSQRPLACASFIQASVRP